MRTQMKILAVIGFLAINVVLYQNCSPKESGVRQEASDLNTIFQGAIESEIQNTDRPASPINGESGDKSLSLENFACTFVIKAFDQQNNPLGISAGQGYNVNLANIQIKSANSLVSCVEQAHIAEAVTQVCTTTYTSYPSGNAALPAKGIIVSSYDRFSIMTPELNGHFTVEDYAFDCIYFQ